MSTTVAHRVAPTVAEPVAGLPAWWLVSAGAWFDQRLALRTLNRAR